MWFNKEVKKEREIRVTIFFTAIVNCTTFSGYSLHLPKKSTVWPSIYGLQQYFVKQLDILTFSQLIKPYRHQSMIIKEFCESIEQQSMVLIATRILLNSPITVGEGFNWVFHWEILPWPPELGCSFSIIPPPWRGGIYLRILFGNSPLTTWIRMFLLHCHTTLERRDLLEDFIWKSWPPEQHLYTHTNMMHSVGLEPMTWDYASSTSFAISPSHENFAHIFP